jgi:hypothetical protein
MDYEIFDWPEKSLISIFENLEFQTQITVLVHLLTMNQLAAIGLNSKGFPPLLA